MTTTQRAATDLLSAAKAMLLKDCPDNPRCEPGHCKWMGDVEQELAAAIEAAENRESLGQKLANAVVVQRSVNRRVAITREEREALEKSKANLECMKAEILSVMEGLEVTRIESGVSYAFIDAGGLHIEAFI